MAKNRGSRAKHSTETRLEAKIEQPKVEPKVEQAASAAFQTGGIEWKQKQDGSAELVVAYEGPLAARDEVIARAGTWREGSGPWAEIRELPLRRQGTRWIGAMAVPAAATVQAVEFVFRANDEWDNGGRAPLGYYEWNPRERRVDVR